MSEFKEKDDLIQKLLEKAGLGFKKGMSKKAREALDSERQMLVLRTNWNNMSVKELKKILNS